MSQVKLNQAEQAIINALPEGMRETAVQTLLSKKSANLKVVTERRNTFQVKVFPSGTVGVYGLGRKFPISLYPSEWDKLIANLDAIKAAIAGLPRE